MMKNILRDERRFRWHKAFKQESQYVEDLEHEITSTPITEIVYQMKHPMLKKGFLLHHDNAKPHISECAIHLLQKNNI